MASILLIEDKTIHRESVQGLLTADGHEVLAIDDCFTEAIKAKALAALMKQPRNYILILDIAYEDNELGGIEVYEDICANGYGGCISDVVIVSIHMNLQDDNFREVEKMMARHNIPKDNLIGKLAGRNPALRARIAALAGGNQNI
jgi:CheY-like chemotaxis protein